MPFKVLFFQNLCNLGERVGHYVRDPAGARRLAAGRGPQKPAARPAQETQPVWIFPVSIYGKTVHEPEH